MTSLGQALREQREARNISIEEIASATKIVSRYLEALEADRLDQMPGGFFIRGIIRTYAKSVGLDPEEVLNRYKAAGLLEAAAPERKIFPRLAPMAAPRPEPAAIVTPVVPTEPAPAIEPAPAAEPEAPPDLETASPTVHFEEAPKPRLSEAARKRILAWTWRGLAAVALVAVIIVVWPSRRHKADAPQPGTTAAEAVVPPSPAAAPGTTPSAAPRSETVTAPAAQAEPAPPGSRPGCREDLEGPHDRDHLPGRDLDPGPHGRRAQDRRPFSPRLHGPGPGRRTSPHPHRQRRRLHIPPERAAGQTPRPIGAGPDGHQDHAGEYPGLPREPVLRPADGVTSRPMLPSV